MQTKAPENSGESAEIASDLLVCRARDGVRTRTYVRTRGFKPPASANSATRAGVRSQGYATCV